MDFGKVSSSELTKIDFSLPKDASDTNRVLKKYGISGAASIYTGCAKWGRKDWVGKIYPEGTKEGDFLSHYARYFNCIELNATFYKVPDAKTVNRWKSMVGKKFKFFPKFPQLITHIKRMKDAELATDTFLKTIMSFEDNLGPCFLQLPPNFSPKNDDILEQYLKSLPYDLEVFIEFRHPGWFAKEIFDKTFDKMEKLKRGSVITDAAGRRDCVHMRLTTADAFIRFVGNSLHKTDYTRIDDWVKRMKQWMEKGIRNIYFFMHQHEELHSPELIKYSIQQLNKQCKLSIPEPVYMYEKQLSLYDSQK